MDEWVTHNIGKTSFHIYDQSCFQYSKIRIADLWSGYQTIPLQNVIDKEIAVRVMGNANKKMDKQNGKNIYGDFRS
jgi:hypothetical protein